MVSLPHARELFLLGMTIGFLVGQAFGIVIASRK